MVYYRNVKRTGERNLKWQLKLQGMASLTLGTGNSVLYKVAPDFRDNELMARGVRIQAQSVDSKDDELSFDVYCYNVQPGYALDYLTGAASKG